MRVLWLSPWFRTLAVAWAGGLRDLGHDVMVVTTGQHFDGPALSPRDVLLEHRWRSGAGLAEGRRLVRTVRSFAPDLVVADQLRDPRLLAAIPRGTRLLVMTHDATPHDSTHRPPPLRRLVTWAEDRRSRESVVFSEHVAALLRADDTEGRRTVHVLPLTSELPDDLVPDLAPAGSRRDFLVVGRLSPYKNIPAVLQAWDLHRAGPAFRGDRLVLVGGGDPGVSIPPHVEWVRGRFRFADLAPRLAGAKASLSFYLAGSQSGVALTSMQCGTGVVVSDVGGLAEYLPPGEAPVARDDVAGLARRLDRLADPDLADSAGRTARREYQAHYQVDQTARRWHQVVSSA